MKTGTETHDPHVVQSSQPVMAMAPKWESA